MNDGWSLKLFSRISFQIYFWISFRSNDSYLLSFISNNINSNITLWKCNPDRVRKWIKNAKADTIFSPFSQRPAWSCNRTALKSSSAMCSWSLCSLDRVKRSSLQDHLMSWCVEYDDDLYGNWLNGVTGTKVNIEHTSLPCQKLPEIRYSAVVQHSKTKLSFDM